MKTKSSTVLCLFAILQLFNGSVAAQQLDSAQQTPLPQPQVEESPQLPAPDAVMARSAPAPVAAFAPLAGVPCWTALGPAPITNGQTQGRTDAVSGRVTAIAIHPTNPNIVYAGTAQGGVYRTLDGGATWVPLLDNALSLAVGAVAIAPSNPTTVFVGTGEGNFSLDSYFGVGVYRIDDAEATATLTGPLNTDTSGNDVFTGVSITRILVDPADANTIFVSTVSGVGGIGGNLPAVAPARGLYRTTTALSATPVFAKLNVPTAVAANGDITDMVLDPGNANTLICAVRGANVVGDGGIWLSIDALAAAPTFTRSLALGNNFNVKLAINNLGGTVTVLAAIGQGSGASCPMESGGGLVRRSVDGGVTFPTIVTAANGFCNGQCFYDIAIAFDPNNTNNIYLGGAAAGSCSAILRRSTDAGATFPTSQTGLHPDTHAIAIAPSNPTIVYTGDDGGIWRSTDSGANWNSLNNPTFSATQFESLALHPTDRNFMIGGTQDNGTAYMRPDGTWTRADFGDGGYSLIDQNAPDTVNVTMYHTYFNSTGRLIGFARVVNVACATDNGMDSEWVFRGFGGTDASTGCAGVARGAANGIAGTDSVLFYAPMALGPGNPNTLYFGTDRLYRSINRGDTMTVVSQGPFAANVPVSAIGISPQNDNVRIVGLRNGSVFATTTGANPLINVTGPIPARFVSRAIIDPNDANTAYVTLAGFGLSAGQHIWKTANLAGGGGTWSASGNGIPDVPVNALVVDPNDSNTLYAGTDIGVFKSSDGGTNWATVGTCLPRVAVFDLAIQNVFRVLRAATHGRGIFELDIEPPKITCPTDIIVGNDPGQCSALVNFTVTATDNLPGVTIDCDAPSGSVFPKGTTTVACTATDAAGNTASCSFTVTVEDQEAPRVGCRPAPNPSAKKIPVSGKNPSSGQNPDGYYQVLARDNCDANPQIYILDTRSSFIAGPFHSGDIVKIRQNPGGTPSSVPGNDPIVAQIHLNGDALAVAADASGNVTLNSNGCLMLIPPDPK